MEKKENYLSPSIKVIEMMSNETVCATSTGTGTEGYGVSSHCYGEDDWN